MGSLTLGAVRRRKALRAIGSKLPRIGWCVRLPDGREIYHDARGYFLVGHTRECAADTYRRSCICPSE